MLQAQAITSGAWKAGIGRDEPLPEKIRKRWREEVDKLQELREVELRRCLAASEGREPTREELHISTDASGLAYGAAAHFVPSHSNNENTSVLISHRGHVSGNQHIGRLKLEAAVLTSEMGTTLRQDLGLEEAQFVLWTDLATTYHWLKNPDLDLKVFVRNRVKKILQSAQCAQWRWLATDSSPACLEEQTLLSQCNTPSGGTDPTSSRGDWRSGPASPRGAVGPPCLWRS